MQAFNHEWEHEGEIIAFSWLGNVDVRPDRVYALAFTPEGDMLLVTDEKWFPAGWLPGGGIEKGETTRQALARELADEANATLYQAQRIGVQKAQLPAGRQSFHAFYWCRITLESDFTPEHEITQRMLVRPDHFLDTLFWGRKDPKAAMLLEKAQELEKRFATG